MPRTLPGSMSTAVTGVITDPSYLVYLGFSTQIIHATKTTTSYDRGNGSESFTAGNGTEVLTVDQYAATIALRNTDNSRSTLVIDETISDIPCEVFQVYGSDVYLLFRGFLSEGEVLDTKVIFNAISSARARNVPSTYITPPTFNHIAPEGLQLRWANTDIVLERG